MSPTHKEKSWDIVEAHHMNTKLHKFNHRVSFTKRIEIENNKDDEPSSLWACGPELDGSYVSAVHPGSQSLLWKHTNTTRVTPHVYPWYTLSPECKQQLHRRKTKLEIQVENWLGLKCQASSTTVPPWLHQASKSNFNSIFNFSSIQNGTPLFVNFTIYPFLPEIKRICNVYFQTSNIKA